MINSIAKVTSVDLDPTITVCKFNPTITAYLVLEGMKIENFAIIHQWHNKINTSFLKSLYPNFCWSCNIESHNHSLFVGKIQYPNTVQFIWFLIYANVQQHTIFQLGESSSYIYYVTLSHLRSEVTESVHITYSLALDQKC